MAVRHACRLVFAGLVAALAVGACDPRTEEVRAERHAGTAVRKDVPVETRSVVLVTIDGVRWQEIFGGVDPRLAEAARLPLRAGSTKRDLLPNVHRLFFEEGTVLGDPRLHGGIYASGPHYVSMPGYLEILTGATTPCHDNDCGVHPATTLLDVVRREASASVDEVAAVTSWEALGPVCAGDVGRAHVSSGRAATDRTPAYPGNQGYRPDRETSVAAIDHLLSHRPRFLWVSLGDTDEWAHRRDYRGYLDALRHADEFLAELAAHLEDMGEYGAHTTLLVTTDHGRDPGFANHGGPDSAKVWLLARGASIASRGAIATESDRHLRDIAPTVRALLGVPQRSCEGCGAPIGEIIDARARAANEH
jgi:hypothetical protein